MLRKILALLTAALLLAGMTLTGMAEPAEAPQPAAGYVLVTIGEQYYWLPLPADEEYSVTLRQTDPETGEELINIVTVTPEGVYMKESTCDNQDCVDEGIVTLFNKTERILGNMIVCLPHRIMLELFTPEEVLALYSNGGAT